MHPFDVDDPMYGVILAREGLECHHHVEFEYYNNPKILTSSFNAKLCAYCAGADGFVDEELNVVWKSVLHVCQECRASGALPIARSRRGNGVQNAQRAQRRRLAALASQARTDAVTYRGDRGRCNSVHHSSNNNNNHSDSNPFEEACTRTARAY